jgi:hypothetical protein
MFMYVGDNNETYPGAASGTDGWQPDDWIYWWPTNNVALSPVVADLGTKAETNIFKCPMDDLRTVTGNDYPYSYLLDSYESKVGGENVNCGFSSISTTGALPQPFTQGQVNAPANKLMLVEATTTLVPPDYTTYEATTPNSYTNWFASCGRFVPIDRDSNLPQNFLTGRHDGLSDDTYGDGHVGSPPPSDVDEFSKAVASY